MSQGLLLLEAYDKFMVLCYHLALYNSGPVSFDEQAYLHVEERLCF